MKLLRLGNKIISVVMLGTFPLFAQESDPVVLDSMLEEISGMEQINDSLLVALNDGGNGNLLFVLNLKGEILNTVIVNGAINHDWESLASDENFLYIGDIGNNSNMRKELLIYKIPKQDLLKVTTVECERIRFNYTEQLSFPPSKDSLFFDAEAMTVYNDSLWIFTKNRSKSGDRSSFVYVVPTTPGEYSVSVRMKLDTGNGGWWTCGVTAADFQNERFYLLTYTKLIVLGIESGNLVESGTIDLKGTSQRESLLVLDNGDLLITNESNIIFGKQKMHTIKKEKIEF